MKLNDEALIALAMGCVAMIFLTIIVGGFYQQIKKNLLYQQIYNKNLECRIAFKDKSFSLNGMDQLCGNFPEIKDFVK